METFLFGTTNALQPGVKLPLTAWVRGARSHQLESVTAAHDPRPVYSVAYPPLYYKDVDYKRESDNDGGEFHRQDLSNENGLAGVGDVNMRARLLIAVNVEAGDTVELGGSTYLAPGHSAPSNPAHGAAQALNVYLPAALAPRIIEKGFRWRRLEPIGSWSTDLSGLSPDTTIEPYEDVWDRRYRWWTGAATNRTGSLIQIIFFLRLRW